MKLTNETRLASDSQERSQVWVSQCAQDRCFYTEIVRKGKGIAAKRKERKLTWHKLQSLVCEEHYFTFWQALTYYLLLEVTKWVHMTNNSNPSETVLITARHQFYGFKLQTACYLTLTMLLSCTQNLLETQIPQRENRIFTKGSPLVYNNTSSLQAMTQLHKFTVLWEADVVLRHEGKHSPSAY